jgi:hypothetical protein
MNDDRAQTGGIDLTAEQILTHPVHADAVKRVGHRSQGADNFEFACNARLMQRPCVSLPLDHAIRALGEVDMVSKVLQAGFRPGLYGKLYG